MKKHIAGPRCMVPHCTRTVRADGMFTIYPFDFMFQLCPRHNTQPGQDKCMRYIAGAKWPSLWARTPARTP